MPKRTLGRTYIYLGKFYGPGEADVPADFAKALDAENPAPEQPEPKTAPAAGPVAPSLPRRGGKPER